MHPKYLVILFPLMILAFASCDRSSPAGSANPANPASTASTKMPQTRHISVIVGPDGFSPNEVSIAKGESVMLMFKRTVEKTCATAVEFPELKIKKDLPLNQDVAIDVPTGESRTLTFQCGMGMYKSKVVIQ
ncbi:MAG: cupredoxin domain-containing protein [Polyangiaceae bacterium]